MDIHNIVKKLIKKYQPRNPYDLAKCLNIIIKYSPLGSVNGYYTCTYRQKFIVLNDNLHSEQEHFTLSHEIGHAVLHPTANTPFFFNNTLLLKYWTPSLIPSPALHSQVMLWEHLKSLHECHVP